MSLIFDNNGFLTPYSAVGSDLETFRRIFVENFGESTTRGPIFESYLAWLDAFRSSVCPTGFYQWLDGSFVTRKTNPNDLDIVTFLDGAEYDRKEKWIAPFKSPAFCRSSRLDLYFVKTYAHGHKQYNGYVYDSAYWLDLFTKTRLKQNKGFVQINFQGHER